MDGERLLPLACHPPFTVKASNERASRTCHAPLPSTSPPPTGLSIYLRVSQTQSHLLPGRHGVHLSYSPLCKGIPSPFVQGYPLPPLCKGTPPPWCKGTPSSSPRRHSASCQLSANTLLKSEIRTLLFCDTMALMQFIYLCLFHQRHFQHNRH